MIWNGKRRFEFAKGLVLSSIVALLAVPTLKVQEKRDIYQILINGEVVGSVKGLEEAEEIVKEARLLVNAESQDLTYLDMEILKEIQSTVRLARAILSPESIGNPDSLLQL